MIIEIKDQWAMLVKDDTLRQNSKKPYEVELIFDESWNGFSKTAIFEAGPASVIVALTADRCTIPTECLKHGSVKLKIGVYGVNGETRKGTVWCETSMIVPDASLGLGSSPSTPPLDDIYSEIMAAIGDLSAAGFEGKTLAEIFRDIKDSACACETATDEEVDKVLSDAFGSSSCVPTDPDEEDPCNTATDKEVDDLLDEVFGKQS